MAFRVLSPEEIELLTEKQREGYMKKLELYKERVKFVEQMERVENRTVTPYEMRRVKIEAVDKAPETEFKTQEVVYTKIDPIEKPDSKVGPIKFDSLVTIDIPEHTPVENVVIGPVNEIELSNPVLPELTIDDAPQYSTIDRLSLDYVKKVEQGESILPDISIDSVPQYSAIDCLTLDYESMLPEVAIESAPQLFEMKAVSLEQVKNVEGYKPDLSNIPSQNFEQFELVDPMLPFVKKTEGFQEFAFTSMNLEEMIKQEQIPKIIVPAIKISEFIAPDQAVPVLPATAWNLPEVAVIDIATQTDPLLPKVNAVPTVNVSFQFANKSEAKLPEISNICLVNASFDKPEITKAELPSVSKLSLPVEKFVKQEHSISALPTVTIPKTNVPSYKVPEISEHEIPTFTKPDVIDVSKFNTAIDVKPQITCPIQDIPSINVPKDYVKITTSNISGIPSIQPIEIPNVYEIEELRKLLMAKEEDVINKGAHA